MQDASLVKNYTSKNPAQLDFRKCASIITDDFGPYLSFLIIFSVKNRNVIWSWKALELATIVSEKF